MKLPIYQPKPIADRRRRRLIQILAHLIDEKLRQGNANLPLQDVVLSGAERAELQDLIEEIASDRSFFAALTFIDGLTRRHHMTNDQLRELYLSERRRRGYSRAVSTSQWHLFLTRLGMRRGDLSTIVRAARPMPFDHFERMEDRLFCYFSIPKSVRNYLLEKIEDNRTYVETIRERVAGLDVQRELGSIYKETHIMLKALKEKRDSLSTRKLAGLTIITVDSTALFTTRDWSVAGTMSTIAGGSCMLQQD